MVRLKYVCVYVLLGERGLSMEASRLRNSTEESPPWPVHVVATNYRDCVCVLEGKTCHKMERDFS